MKQALMRAIAVIAAATASPVLAHEVTMGAKNAWVLPTPPGAPVGAGYLTIFNPSGHEVRLVGGNTLAAKSVELHEMAFEHGVMKMRPVPAGVAAPPHGSVALRPGGYHLMLIAPSRPYRLGDHIPVTLRFIGAAPLRVIFPVQASPDGRTR